MFLFHASMVTPATPKVKGFWGSKEGPETLGCFLPGWLRAFADSGYYEAPEARYGADERLLRRDLALE